MTMALVMVVIVTYFSKNNLTPQQQMRYSQGSFSRFSQCFSLLTSKTNQEKIDSLLTTSFPPGAPPHVPALRVRVPAGLTLTAPTTAGLPVVTTSVWTGPTSLSRKIPSTYLTKYDPPPQALSQH